MDPTVSRNFGALSGWLSSNREPQALWNSESYRQLSVKYRAERTYGVRFVISRGNGMDNAGSRINLPDITG